MRDPLIWDGLLRRYVDSAGRVDYENWQRHDRDTLQSWLEGQSRHTSDRADHLAHWINLYNAFTIQAVLRAYPIASIRPTLLGLPNWPALLAFFNRRLHRLDGASISLAWIENVMLRRLGDPRIHFAIVCASRGCPLLRNHAYEPGRIDRQLDEDRNRFIRNSEKVHLEGDRGLLFCSRIFQWYRSDFLASASSVAEYILPHLDDAAAVSPAALRLVHLPYDWGLNQRTSS
ncbi:DUF547 domain-containing protein [Synechococcus sp. RSCCF101]|uniref:DUF547 domain-containing protein n=1 Tax=Synechococcus sp. RSCCF101 TaxID=2511069 RepID=UPI0012456B2B|nr:DUF547 domain-containing protein [Synechococcus sp. RSCCF101]QEY31631.1 DUF547 domain-containing protein [Synechococcus sp. RSCCF101]